MEPSPRPSGYPDSAEEYNDFEDSDEDYIGALQKASADDIASLVADGDDGDEDAEEESRSRYSHEAVQEEYDDADYLGQQEYDMQSRTSQQSHVEDNLEQGYELSEAGSPELGNTVIEAGKLNSAMLAAASNVENFVDEPERESDATSVSLGQFVPNSVSRTRPPPPQGQRRSSVKGLRRSSADDSNAASASSKKPSSRTTTPRRSKPSSPRSVSHVSSPRSTVRSNSQYSEQSQRRGSARSRTNSQYSESSRRRDSVRSNSQYSEQSSHRESMSEDDFLNGGSSLREPSPTMISVYQDDHGGLFQNRERPDGVPALDFGLSINSNVSWLPRDDHDSEREEFARQLQLDYDTLLGKYAQAENTIDQLRLGAKVNLFGDEPVPSEAVQNSFSMAKQPQMTQTAQPQQASRQRIINIVK